MPFLGSCEVCGKQVRTYRGLAGHLRHNSDPQHAELKCRWVAFKATHHEAFRGKSPATRAQRQAMRFRWSPGDGVCTQVALAMERGDRVADILRNLSITYKVFRAIGVHLKGEQGYLEWSRSRKMASVRAAGKALHAKYASMTPEEKAARYKRLFGGTCALEASMAAQIRGAVSCPMEMNVWTTLPVNGALVPREIDILLTLPSGRKAAILCDGEAFHGPKSIFDPVSRVQNDVATAEAFFAKGYTVLRYAESEIKQGEALRHLLGVHSCWTQTYSNLIDTTHLATVKPLVYQSS